MTRNPDHIPLPEVKAAFNAYADAASVDDARVDQMAGALDNPGVVKALHPALIARYQQPRSHHRDTPIRLVGLDIETDAQTGAPMLLGFWHPDSNTYQSMARPALHHLYEMMHLLSDSGPTRHIAVWGTLDIQALMRLFAPEEAERERISRGMSGNVRDGEMVGTPPLTRKLGSTQVYVDHYFPGRGLKLGYLRGKRSHSIWVYNIAQFYQTQIGVAARAFGLPWRDYPRETHIIDWTRYDADPQYCASVLASNRQDAQTVLRLAQHLQQRFYDLFHAYPRQLVSSGALNDAATSKLLSDRPGDPDAYASANWQWLVKHLWTSHAPEEMREIERLLGGVYSAAYIDQFGMGYWPEAWTADIASAYPSQVRKLPDLRYAHLRLGHGQLEADIEAEIAAGREIESAVIQGTVTIPPSLHYHPIALKRPGRDNIRPAGTFGAGYTLEERRYCKRHGASFADERYVIVSLSKRVKAPIADVSDMLGGLREELTAQRDTARASDRKKALEGQQAFVKSIDNSGYGKMVQMLEIVKDSNAGPTVTGYTGGDRLNVLYGLLVTSRLRVQMAEALTAIEKAGGRPILAMTDAIYWYGPGDALPADMVKAHKTAGYFESPRAIRDLYVVKAGQHEYYDPSRKPEERWQLKLRGLRLDRDRVEDGQPLYRPLVKAVLGTTPRETHPADIVITIPTRRLLTIGNPDLEHLGAVQEGVTELHPFVLSPKQAERVVYQYRRCINGHVWLAQPREYQTEPVMPLEYLNELDEQHWQQRHGEMAERAKARARRYRSTPRARTLGADRVRRHAEAMAAYIERGERETGKPPPKPGPNGHWTWAQLVAHYGIAR